MKAKISFCLLFLGFFTVSVNAYEKALIAISPGSDEGIAIVAQSCPTFSWTAVDWAESYRLAVFEKFGAEALTYEEMEALVAPVLSNEIRGRALSWTPSSDERLSVGGEYVWYVQALDAYGQGLWSEGSVFKVDVAFNFDGAEEKVRKRLQEQGMSENIIDGVLEDMKSEVKDVISYGVDLHGSSDDIQNRTGTQSSDVGVNTYYGEFAGAGLLAGANNNTFMGYASGYKTSTTDNNTFMGFLSGYNNTAAENTFIGSWAGYNNTSGFQNTFMGYYAGKANNTGYRNTFMGYYAGAANTSGYRNTFVGRHTGKDNINGEYNVFIGDQAGRKNTSGNFNTYLGTAAGENNNVGSGNTFIGQGTGYTNTGVDSIFIGRQAGYHETGSYKLYIDSSNTSSPLIWGDFANEILTVHGRLGVGTKTPGYPMELERTGTNASIIVDRTDGAMNYINATASFANFGSVRSHPLRLVVNSLWTMRLDSNGSLTMRNGATCTAGGEWQNASSRELKENIRDLTIEEAAEALEELEPVRFNYKADKEDESVGFIAEDVPDLVATKDRKGMSAMDVVAVLTKVLQEQQRTVEEQQETIMKLENRIAKLEKR